MTSTSALVDPDDRENTSAFAFFNYRLFFFGNSLSNIGTWFQTLAQALLVVRLTHRASSLGEVIAIQWLPLLLFGPFVGSFIDRANLRKILVVISTLAGLEALALAALVQTHHITIYWVFGLTIVLGFCQIFLQPTIRTMVSELVPNSALPSGVSFNAVQQAVGRLVGPAVAGILYAWRGPATCFVVNGISYAIVLATVLLLRKDRLYPRPDIQRSSRQMLTSLSYVWNSPFHRSQLIASLIIGVFAFNFPLVWASLTQFVLHSGSASLGLGLSIDAVFGLLSGLTLARHLRRPTIRTYVFGCVLLGVSLAFGALVPNVIAFYFVMALVGVANVTYSTINQTVLQLNTPRERIGSVMTLLTYCQQGTTPIGSLIVGAISSIASVRVAIGLGAVAAIGTALVLSIRPQSREVA